MGIRACASVLAIVCVAASAQSASTANDSVAIRVEELFAKADDLGAQRPQRSLEYLWSLPDEQLAEVLVKATAPQPQPQSAPAESKPLPTESIQKVARERAKTIEELVTKYGSPLSEEEGKDERAHYQKISDDLAGLGPAAVPAISLRMGEADRQTGRWAVARESLAKMGPAAIEPLMPLVQSPDRTLAGNAVQILGLSADARTKDVLLQALEDESRVIRKNALQGLSRLGPSVVGPATLNAILIERLEDDACLHESIQGLSLYGDETALEPLRVVERFHPGVGKKGSLRSFAAGAINSILRRMGKPAEEVMPVSDKEPDYDAIVAAAACPNAAIRGMAVGRLEDHRDDRTAGLLIERLHQEENAAVREQVIRSLGIITTRPQQPADTQVSSSKMQELFDALLLKARTSSDSDVRQRIAAIDSAGTILRSASLREVRLDRVDQFKEVVRQGLSSDSQERQVACYRACTAVAMAAPATTEGWTTQEREQLVQQLTPFLNVPTPPIRLIECLGSLADRRLTPRFLELLGHNDPIIRTFAAYALGEIGDPQALPALGQLIESDPSQYENGVYGVREAARNAIERITKPQPE